MLKATGHQRMPPRNDRTTCAIARLAGIVPCRHGTGRARFRRARTSASAILGISLKQASTDRRAPCRTYRAAVLKQWTRSIPAERRRCPSQPVNIAKHHCEHAVEEAVVVRDSWKIDCSKPGLHDGKLRRGLLDEDAVRNRKARARACRPARWAPAPASPGTGSATGTARRRCARCRARSPACGRAARR